MRSDARVRYTKAVLRESFLKLLRRKSVDKITVTELCALADINRATFYSHYNDCFDLLRSIEEDFLEAFRNTGRSSNWCDSRELITAIYDTIEENREVCDVLIFGVKNPALLTRMIETAREHCISRWRENLRTLSPERQDMLFIYLATGLSSVMYTRFATTPRDELIDFMVQITDNCLAPYRSTGA